MKAKASLLPIALVCCAFSLLIGACAWSKAPKKAFSEATCPARPDYSNLDNWAAHPEKADLADGTPLPSLKDNQEEGPVDVFFLHPTTLFGTNEWNGNPLDEKLNKRTDKTTIKHQASIFNGTGRVFAPRYRQMILGAFYDPYDLNSNRQAFTLAYADLKASFEYYLAHYNNGRPIMIAAHSQGSAHAIHLLKDFFDGKPLQNQLVAAYLPGWPVPADTFQVLKPCSNPEETGCFATWCSFEWGTYPKNMHWYEGAVVVNPITWRSDTLPSSVEAHKGTVMGGYDEIFQQVLKAKVHDHILWATRPKIKGTSIIRSNNFHIADYNLFWRDVRENAILRTEQFLQHSSTK